MARSYALARGRREALWQRKPAGLSNALPWERDRYYQQLSFKRDYYVETLKAQGGTPRPRSHLLRGTETRSARERRRQTPRAPREDERSRAESALLFHMLQSREAATLVLKESPGAAYSDEGFRNVCTGLLQAYERQETPNVPLLIAGMDKASAERVSAALREEAACEDPAKAAKDCLCRIEQYDLAQRIEEIKRKLGEPAIQPAQRAEYLREMQMLNLQMRGLR
jgi:hypothetical protein